MGFKGQKDAKLWTERGPAIGCGVDALRSHRCEDHAVNKVPTVSIKLLTRRPCELLHALTMLNTSNLLGANAPAQPSQRKRIVTCVGGFPPHAPTTRS